MTYFLFSDGTRLNLVEDNGLYYFHLEQIISPEENNCMVAMTKPHLRPEILGNGNGGLFFLTGRDLADLQCDLDIERKVLYTNAGGFI